MAQLRQPGGGEGLGFHPLGQGLAAGGIGVGVAVGAAGLDAAGLLQLPADGLQQRPQGAARELARAHPQGGQKLAAVGSIGERQGTGTRGSCGQAQPGGQLRAFSGPPEVHRHGFRPKGHQRTIWGLRWSGEP